jgi:flagellar hook assembly protein FlgD
MAIGAKVVLQAGGKTYTQFQVPNHGALMNKSNRLFCGLGASTVIDKVTVSWPNGTVNAEEFTAGLTANSAITITEGSGIVVTSIDEPNSLATQYVSVYPNPSLDAVSFAYELKETSNVTIEIYSLVGERVATVISETQAMGSHNITWNGDALPAGVYSYRISTVSGQKNGLVTLVR